MFDDFGLEGVNCFLRQLLVCCVVENSGKSVEVGRGNTVSAGLGVIEAVFES
jgi:hypothetical protein